MRHTLAALVGALELAEEADELVAIVALFGLQRYLLADHARGLLDEFLLELVDRVVLIPRQQHLYLERWEPALTQYVAHLVVRQDKVEAIPVAQRAVCISVHLKVR